MIKIDIVGMVVYKMNMFMYAYLVVELENAYLRVYASSKLEYAIIMKWKIGDL